MTDSTAGRITIEDVARSAGVSRATVWRALNQPESVSTRTSDKVKRAVADVGYFPDIVARSFRTSRSSLVAIVAPTLHQAFFRAIQRAGVVASRAGFETVLGITDYDPQVEYDIVTKMLGRRVGGLLIVGSDQLPQTRTVIERTGTPVVQLWDVDGEPMRAMIGFSNRAVGRAAATHLLERGRRCIAMLHDPERPRARRRIEGMQEIFGRAGLPAQNCIAVNIGNGAEPISSHLDRLFQSRGDVDAIYANGDQLALEAVHWLHESGRSVPGDVAVLGFGDDSFSAFVSPTISTVSVPEVEIGDRAIAALFAMMEGGEDNQPQPVCDLGCHIIQRETT
ncbi:LacI family DNA-binding transcriptional regulator [Oceaniglobus trochenteri]|uniref:LacI family DNA-binding transcriptional regulator n=1 Tax=Oceaniglobus trochenteri TaxID=2763260 RepID=UPI001CFF8BA3|nr:LacI family DNA-binding transcriptional regulator [Oceaniglobus trochenteri]